MAFVCAVRIVCVGRLRQGNDTRENDVKTLLTAAICCLLAAFLSPFWGILSAIVGAVCLLAAVCFAIVIGVNWWLFKAYDVQVGWLGTAEETPAALAAPECANDVPSIHTLDVRSAVCETPYDMLAVLATELAWERISPRTARIESARRVNQKRSAERLREKETGTFGEFPAETVQSAACGEVSLTVRRRILKDEYQKGTPWMIEVKGCNREDADVLRSFWEGLGWAVEVRRA